MSVSAHTVWNNKSAVLIIISSGYENIVLTKVIKILKHGDMSQQFS